MRNFEIHISYSWGDKEPCIKLKKQYAEEAFEYMIDLASKEAKVCMESHEDTTIDISIRPWQNRIILRYGYDNEECYYDLVEKIDTKTTFQAEDLITMKNESYTAFIYEDDGITTADLSTYDNKEEAIEFAKHRNWDEVVNDITGEVVWNR